MPKITARSLTNTISSDFPPSCYAPTHTLAGSQVKCSPRVVVFTKKLKNNFLNQQHPNVFDLTLQLSKFFEN